MRKRNKRQLLQLFIAGLVLLTLAIVPTLGIPGLPRWDEIFVSAGLRGGETDSMPVRVHFIDVGQGDCTLLQAGEESLLIDGGNRGNDEKITEYLKNQSVKSLDYLIITHMDSDHIGSLPELIALYPPKQIIMPRLNEKNTPTTKIYTKLLEAVKASGAKVIAAQPGAIYSVGDATLEILAPLEQYNDSNNNSVVAKLSFGTVSYLFVGDAESKSENDLLRLGADLRADVLKVGHHGSSSSSGKEFLAAVKPAVAVISCGKNNSYGHPHEEILARLSEIGAQILRTDQQGSIVIASNGKDLLTKNSP